MKFDLISDIHLDELYYPLDMESFVYSILPKNPSETLVFAGDFGYDNEQNFRFLFELRKIYKTILYVYGNNDIKTWDNATLTYNAASRVSEFEAQVSRLDGVFHLQSKIHIIDGISFGGNDLFYDFEHISNVHHLPYLEINRRWTEKKLHLRHQGIIDDPFHYAHSLKKQLLQIIESCDVIITHGSPDFFHKSNDLKFGFYHFDGHVFLPYIQNKIWCFGHEHIRRDVFVHGCRFINACYQGKHRFKGIITIEVKK